MTEETHKTSPVVQWPSLHASKAGGLGLIPGQGTRSHMLQPRPGTTKYICVCVYIYFIETLWTQDFPAVQQLGFHLSLKECGFNP